MDYNKNLATNYNIALSSYTITRKLLLIISIIILVSLSVIISLATYFFKKDGITRIEENTLEVVGIQANNIISKFISTSKNLKLLGDELISNKSERFEKLFFENESEILYVGIYKKENGELKLIKKIINNYTQGLNEKESNLSFDKIITTHQEDFFSSIEGGTLLRNFSDEYPTPIIGMSIPFEEINSEKSIILCFLKLSSILESFQTSGITKTVLVDEKGNILASPNQEDIINKVNLSNLEIFKALDTSKSNIPLKMEFKDSNGIEFIGSYKKLGFSGGGLITIVEKDKALEEVYAIQRRNIYLMIAVLMFAIIIVYVFANSLTKPILKLVTAARQIESGNYHVNLPIPSKDEVGVLTHSFNSMSKGLDEREKMKDAFGKFVNKELAEMAMKGEIKLGGERKYCAIFFSDIRSFTSISEKLEPEEVVEFLNAYMTEMVNCVNRTNGIVDKFIGDAIMATWGALKQDDNAVENSINGTLMMREALLRFNKGRGSDKKPIIKIGCGINSGYVISGQIGSNERLEYTVIGDAVNLASRIESLNKPFGTDILISEEAYSKVDTIFNVEKMQTIKVKGKEEAQTIYAVLGRKDDPTCPKTLKELREIIGIEMDEEDKTVSKKKGKKSSAEEKEVKYEILE